MARDPKKGSSSSKGRRSGKRAVKRRAAAKRAGKLAKNASKARGSSSSAGRKADPAGLARELKEAHAREAATAEILKIIASSPDDVKPVFEAIVKSAVGLCGARFGAVFRMDGDLLNVAADHGFGPVQRRLFRTLYPMAPNRGHISGRAILDGAAVQIPDVSADEQYTSVDTKKSGFRSLLAAPLLHGSKAIGSIVIFRAKPGTFLESQSTLLQSFAAQAVIAIENARLFNETREALERQTATADILKVIASSPSDVQPVFDAIAESARRVVGAYSATVTRVLGEQIHLAAFTSTGQAGRDTLTSMYPQSFSAPTVSGNVVRTRKVVLYADTEVDGDDTTREVARARGFRSVLGVPMLRDGKAIGSINVTRTEPGGFDDHTIGLMKTFADQAVIAIENTRLFNETKEALERQTATADILKVIASSPNDVQPVFDEILRCMKRLFGGEERFIFLVDDDGMVSVGAAHSFQEAEVRARFPRPLPGTASELAIRERRPVAFGDTFSDPDTPAAARAIAQAAGKHLALAMAPLMSDDRGVGTIMLTRPSAMPFTEKELTLLGTFADQAVIAIQNVRLFNETNEALARQTATADVLKVIASSPSNLQPVFDAIAERSKALIGAHASTVTRHINSMIELAAFTPVSPEADAVLRSRYPRPVIEGESQPEQILRGEIVQITDAELQDPAMRDTARARGWRSRLLVPLKDDSGVVGWIAATRREPGSFADKDVELLQTFADQAVIAIQNVELFEEVQARTRDLQESLQQQTATADVLKVISRSAFDLRTVLNTLVESAGLLCVAERALIMQPGVGLVASWGLSPSREEFLKSNLRPITTLTDRVFREGKAVHIHDVLEAPGFDVTGDDDAPRTRLGVPLIRDGTLIGAFLLARMQVRPFTDRQIELVQTFADQAVIAIENARLFNETKEALARQTATADVLKVIASSPSNLQPVFDAIAERSKALIGAHSTIVVRLVDGMMELAAFTPVSPKADTMLQTLFPIRPSGSDPQIAKVLRGEIAEITDAEDDSQTRTIRDAARARGWRSQLLVPLKDDGGVIGWMSITRKEVGSFAEKDVELLRTFADQAVIAISNVELFQAVQDRTSELSRSLDDLRAAQDRLVQTEKLASLGQLTAGIAHEIKNPLNFINNFSALSGELIDELDTALAPVTLDEKTRGDIGELTAMLKSNLEKVVQHGKRADSIVKNMLLHSREGKSERRGADINALVEESLNLAYHGARAERSDFQITLERDLDPDAGSIELYPQEITRALLNMISNGFYAATRRAKEAGNGFEPTLRAATRGHSDRVEIRIRDNGSGIPPDVKERMFNPFFTTKPPGEGTGLGLSMTHDIVVKQHGGTIDVATEPGSFTEFLIVLPRAQ